MSETTTEFAQHDEWCPVNGCRCGKCPCAEMSGCPPKTENAQIEVTSAHRYALGGILRDEPDGERRRLLTDLLGRIEAGLRVPPGEQATP